MLFEQIQREEVGEAAQRKGSLLLRLVIVIEAVQSSQQSDLSAEAMQLTDSSYRRMEP